MESEKGSRLISTREAANMLGVKPATLYQWRWREKNNQLPATAGNLPRGVKVGSRAVRYDLHEVRSYITRRRPGDGQ